MASLAYYFVFLLCLHACTARLLQHSSKDVKTTSATGKLDHHGSNIVHLDNQKFSSVQEGENIGGRKIQISYSWTVMHQATRTTEISKRSERSMMESTPSNAEENVSSNDNDNVEDIEVMDYAQPHRKPPIHNKGT